MFFLCRTARANGEPHAGRRPTATANWRPSPALRRRPPSPQRRREQRASSSCRAGWRSTPLLGDDRGGLAAVEPILDRFAFECFVEFAAAFVHWVEGGIFN